MKLRHRTTSELITATQATRSGAHEYPGGAMHLDEGDWLVKRADGTHEGYQESHPFWQDYRPVKIVRIVRVDDNGTRTFRIERLTRKGWVVKGEGATLAEARAARASAESGEEHTETVVEVTEDGVKV